MFTGLVEELGVVQGIVHAGEGARMSIRADMFRGAGLGESIAVCGACVTIVEAVEDIAIFDLSPETVDKTILGELTRGDRVNLERALQVGARMGGHFVQGHVDGVGSVVRLTPKGNGAAELVVRPPEAAMPYLVPKGSVAIDGISLTVVDAGNGVFSVALIPFTISHTTLKDVRPGRRVNIESDILAKYAARAAGFAPSSGITEDLLKSYGY